MVPLICAVDTDCAQAGADERRTTSSPRTSIAASRWRICPSRLRHRAASAWQALENRAKPQEKAGRIYHQKWFMLRHHDPTARQFRKAFVDADGARRGGSAARCRAATRYRANPRERVGDL